MDEKLVRAAEVEMRRTAPQVQGPPRKRMKSEHETKETSHIRYDYEGLDDISGGIKGFMLSCVYDRQRSAMHEFLKLIRDYLPLEEVKSKAKAQAAPKAKRIVFNSDDEGEEKSIEPEEQNGAKQEDKCSKDSKEKDVKEGESEVGQQEGTQNQGEEEEKVPKYVKLCPIKMSCQGAVFFKINGWENLPAESHPTKVVEKILNDLGPRSHLKHCQRIVPVEGVFEMKEEALKSGVAAIMASFKANESEETLKSLDTFAVLTRERSHKKGVYLDKKDVITLTATGVEEGMKPLEVKVNLEKPKMAFIVEGLPMGSKYLACMSIVKDTLLDKGSKLRLKATGLGTSFKK